MEFDAEAGTMTYTVNDVSQGVCFSGLKGVELFPAIAFYDSRLRSASIVSVTVNGIELESSVVVATAAAASLVDTGSDADVKFRFDPAASSPSITFSPDRCKVRPASTTPKQ